MIEYGGVGGKEYAKEIDRGSVSRKFSAVQHPQAQRRHTTQDSARQLRQPAKVEQKHTYIHTERQIDRYRYRYTRTLELLMHTNYYNDISRLSKTRESEKAAATRRGAMS